MKASLFPLVSLALLAAPAAADTIRVPQDHATIQGAVDAAVAGDVVTVSSGTYRENITINSELAGLSVIGKGNVIVDALGPAAADAPDVGTLDGFLIEANNVTLKGLTIRHAQHDGVMALAGSGDGEPLVSGLVLDKLFIVNSGSRGLHVYANDVLITRCVVFGAGTMGVTVTGDDAEGNNAMINKNSVDAVADNIGLEVHGAIPDRHEQHRQESRRWRARDLLGECHGTGNDPPAKPGAFRL